MQLTGGKCSILFFVGKISYYMVTPATSFCDADSKWEKLVGGGSVIKCPQKTDRKLFFPSWALPRPMKLLPLALTFSFVEHRELPEFCDAESKRKKLRGVNFVYNG